VIPGSLTAEPAITRLLEILVSVGLEVLLFVREGAEEEVQYADTVRELAAVDCVKALTEVEDRIVDRLFVGGIGDPIVVQEVFFQEGQLVRADL